MDATTSLSVMQLWLIYRCCHQPRSETDRQAWDATLQLPHRHQLTLYDAAYLSGATSRLPLATLDSDLRTAAITESVDLLGREIR